MTSCVYDVPSQEAFSNREVDVASYSSVLDICIRILGQLDIFIL